MDEELLERARQGDEEAFARLMTPLENRIWRVCWHYMGERESAADCGQETMLRVWKGLDSYRGDCAFETWVGRVAANCCLDALRRRKREKSESIEPLREQGFDPPDPKADTEEQVVAADQKRRLREGIRCLPEDQREALIMTQLEGIPYERAAELLGVSEGTVKSRVNRAKHRLRDMLDGELSSETGVQIREGRNRS